MAELPETVLKEWENRESSSVFTTVNKDGIPNSIYVTCIRIYDEQRIVIADNYFQKTLGNIRTGCEGAVLFITKERKSYQIKGKVEYETDGEIKNFMRECLDPKYPVRGVAVLNVEEAYNGSEKLL